MRKKHFNPERLKQLKANHENRLLVEAANREARRIAKLKRLEIRRLHTPVTREQARLAREERIRNDPEQQEYFRRQAIAKRITDSLMYKLDKSLFPADAYKRFLEFDPLAGINIDKVLDDNK